MILRVHYVIFMDLREARRVHVCPPAYEHKTGSNRFISGGFQACPLTTARSLPSTHARVGPRARVHHAQHTAPVSLLLPQLNVTPATPARMRTDAHSDNIQTLPFPQALPCLQLYAGALAASDLQM